MKACPLCGSVASKHLALAHTQVWECSNLTCRLQFASPQLGDADLEQVYRRLYYPQAGDAQPARFESTPVAVLRQAFLGVARQLGDLKGRKILDYGCGRGALCQVAHEHGLEPTGIEPDPSARRELLERGSFRVYRDVEELKRAQPDARFDLITLWEVVEHLRHPWHDLEQLRSLLMPDGRMLISTPNASCLKARLLAWRWRDYANPTHFYYLTRQSLQAILHTSGYSRLEEWRLKLRYPRQNSFRSAFQGLLRKGKLQGELLFAARAGNHLERPAHRAPRRNVSASQESSRPLGWDSEKAARGGLLKIGPYRRLAILGVETILLPLARILKVFGGRAEGGEDAEVRSILVAEYWNLGDVVILLPFLRNLRAKYPDAKISLLMNPGLVPLLEGQGLADELLPIRVPWAQHFARWRKYNPFSTSWLRLIRAMFELRQRRFDLALTGRMDIRDNILLWLSGAKRRVGYAVGGGGFLLTDVVEPDLRRPHRAQVWLRLLEHLGKEILETQPRLMSGKEESEFAEQFLAERGIEETHLLVGVHPGARIPTRRWGYANFSAVAARLSAEFSIKILWFLDPNRSGMEEPPPRFAIPVSLPFHLFMAVLARCHLLISNDSGPMHVATALRVPVVAVFGPTEPEWFGPLGENNRVIIRREFWCRPCFDYCVFDQPYCLRTISTEDVLDAAVSALRDVSRNRQRKGLRGNREDVHIRTALQEG